MSEQTEKPDECECCQFETKKLAYYDAYVGGGWYCDLCSGTMASTFHRTPLDRDVELYRTICYVGNAIIEEIRKGKR